MRDGPISRHITSFKSRLNRVEAARAPYEEGKQPVEVLPDWKQHFRIPVAIMAAVAIGALAVLAVRFGRMQYMGGGFAGDNPDVTMAIDIGAAFALAFLLFLVSRFSGLFTVVGNLVGVFAMVGFMHNAAHKSPEFFSSIFSGPWTTEIAMASEPGSLYFRGDYITVMPEAEEIEAEAAAEEEPEEEALPRVIRLQ